MCATMRHPRDVRPRGFHHIPQCFRSNKRQKRIAPAMRDERVQMGSVPRQTFAPHVASEPRSRKHDETRKRLGRRNEYFGREHRPLRKPADDEPVARDAVVFLQRFQRPQERLFGLFEARGVFIEALHRGIDVASHEVHHQLIHADVPPRAAVHARTHGDFERRFGKEPTHVAACIDDACEADEVVSGRAETVTKQNGGAISAALTITAPARMHAKRSDGGDIHGAHGSAKRASKSSG